MKKKLGEKKKLELKKLKVTKLEGRDAPAGDGGVDWSALTVTNTMTETVTISGWSFTMSRSQ